MGILKHLRLPEIANLGCLPQAFLHLTLTVDTRCVTDFGIVEISHQSQKGTTSFYKFSTFVCHQAQSKLCHQVNTP